MPKPTVRFVCRSCGYESPKWFGKCPSCSEWGSLDEAPQAIHLATRLGPSLRSSSAAGSAPASAPKSIAEVASPEEEGRSSTGIGELDRVLGGGVVRGAVILVGGAPGIGKSTLLTQAAANLAAHCGKTIYVSGEESAPQIKRRAQRLEGVSCGGLLVENETDITRIEATLLAEQPEFVVVDSIQTMQHPEAESMAGSVWQVRTCTTLLTNLAKTHGIGIFLVGHVTKEGTLAGPRVLEHMVDAVLTFEGDHHSIYRILRANKNRFGSAEEMGIFEMHEGGLREVPNPSEFLLSERPADTVGSAVTCAVEGSRPLLVEVQSLVAPSHLNNPRRAFTGIESGRIHMVLAVLEKRAGLALAYQDVFINIVGGVKIEEPAADLAVAVATASHLRNLAVDRNLMIVGEVGLAGEVRAVSHIEKRFREAARLGFTRVMMSSRNKASLRGGDLGVRVDGVDSVSQAISLALSEPASTTAHFEAAGRI